MPEEETNSNKMPSTTTGIPAMSVAPNKQKMDGSVEFLKNAGGVRSILQEYMQPVRVYNNFTNAYEGGDITIEEDMVSDLYPLQKRGGRDCPTYSRHVILDNTYSKENEPSSVSMIFINPVLAHRTFWESKSRKSGKFFTEDSYNRLTVHKDRYNSVMDSQKYLENAFIVTALNFEFPSDVFPMRGYRFQASRQWDVLNDKFILVFTAEKENLETNDWEKHAILIGDQIPRGLITFEQYEGIEAKCIKAAVEDDEKNKGKSSQK